MSFENRLERIEANRMDPREEAPAPASQNRETGLGTMLLWALFLGLVWVPLAYPFGAALAFAILGPVGAIFLIPYLLFWRRRRSSPERSALLDLLNLLNPFH